MRKLYGQTSFGQLHVRLMPSNGHEQGPPLVCLHPAPSSGLYFETALPMLNDGRRVIAPDYPGYGGSDPLPEMPSIGDYARAMLECLEDLSITDPVDLLGFHTGCLVAVEMTMQKPSAAHRLVLCDVPHFTPEVRKSLLEKMAVPTPIGAELESIQSAWTFNVEKRIKDVPLPRTMELLAEQLRAPARDHYGFAAAFSYASEEALEKIAVETTVLATQSALHEQSIAAAKMIPAATLVDVTEVSSAVFESGADSICKRINSALQ